METELIAALEEGARLREEIIRAQQQIIAAQDETILIREAENVSSELLERWHDLPDTR